MIEKDRRHHPRLESLNLLEYDCIDETDQVVMRGMGRTLNISGGGVLLETHVQIDPKYTVVIAIGLKDEMIDIKGKVAYSISGRDEKFEAGIEFTEIDETGLEILKKYINAFHKQ